MDALWGKDVFVDVENGVNTAIRKLRLALRDSPEAPTFIETVPGKGYRFIAAVEAPTDALLSPLHSCRTAHLLAGGQTSAAEAEAVATKASVGVPEAASGSVLPRGRPARALSWSPTVAALAGAFSGGGTRPADSGTRVTIAVLPFDNLNGDPESDYLASGLTEDTIVSLGRIDPERVSVIGRTSMIAYRGTSKSLAEIGRELGDRLSRGELTSRRERPSADHRQADSRARPGADLVRLLRQQHQQRPRLAAGDQLCHRRAGQDPSFPRSAARAGAAAHAETPTPTTSSFAGATSSASARPRRCSAQSIPFSGRPLPIPPMRSGGPTSPWHTARARSTATSTLGGSSRTRARRPFGPWPPTRTSRRRSTPSGT